MESATFEFTDEQLAEAGLIGDGINPLVTQAIETMRKYPELLKLSLFTLQCMNKRHTSSASSARSGGSVMPSNRSANTLISDCTRVSEHAPDEYEKVSYYNGITGNNDDHPALIYRSNFLTTPFSKPVGRFPHIPLKTVRGVFGTPLNLVWDIVGPQIRDLMKAKKINWSSIDTARFYTHGPPGEEKKGSLGPVVIWVGVIPDSTSAETAHEVSQEILAILLENQIDDVVVEWREAVVQRLAGRSLLPHVDSNDPTHHVRRFLTPLLGVPLVAEGMEEDAQGTLTLWFHENKDKHGNLSDKVYGVTNCHVLRKATTVEYRYEPGAPKEYVRVCGERRFQQGLDEITNAIQDHVLLIDDYGLRIARLLRNEDPNEQHAETINDNQRQMEKTKKALAALAALYDEVTKSWSNIQLDRNIGHLQYAAPITVRTEVGARYTSDWAAFLATEAKVKDKFEGNVIDLGSKYSRRELQAMFYSVTGGSTTFKFPEERRLKITGCTTKEDLDNPAECDSDGIPCINVGKDGNSTGLTIGRYAGLISFARNEIGVESMELGIYNSGVKGAEPFSEKGDSGSLVWHSKEGKAFIVGQLHSGGNKGGSTSDHITYCTPGWYLLDQIRKEFEHADFYRTSW